MVGGHTLLREDPRLTVKSEELGAWRRAQGLPENPIKVSIVSKIEDPQSGPSVADGGKFLTAGPTRVELLAYVVGKPAQEALILSIVKELASSGVTANILQVRTIDAAHERDREPSRKNASWMTPEKITAAILYLCSEEAHVVNGARLPLYGDG